MFETYFCKLEKKVTSTYTLIQIDNKKNNTKKKIWTIEQYAPSFYFSTPDSSNKAISRKFRIIF